MIATLQQQLGGDATGNSMINNGTIGFNTAPNVYISNATNTNIPALASTLSATTATINSIAVNTGGAGWTAIPTVFY